MSITLPKIDLSTFPVGSTGKVDFNPIKDKIINNPGESGDPGHIRIFNDSGSTLQIWSDDGSVADYIPAGGWPTYEVPTSISFISFTVLFILPNPPVQLLMPTYYLPGENVPPVPILGNSPVGIGGTVTTSSVQTLSNEGGATGILVIDMGDSTLSQLIVIYNDGHAVFAVDQAGVKHQVIKIQSSGNPLQLGAVGDKVQALGNFEVDGFINVNSIRDNVTGADQVELTTTGITIQNLITLLSNIILPNNIALQVKDLGGTARDVFKVDGANEVHINTITGTDIFALLNAVGTVYIKSTPTIPFGIPGKAISSSSTGGDLCDWGGHGTFLKGNPSNQGPLQFQGKNGNTDFVIGAMSTFTGAATGTYSHGMLQFGAAAAPDIVVPMCDVSGSQTMGYDTVTTTQVHITSFSGLGFKAWCAKFS